MSVENVSGVWVSKEDVIRYANTFPHCPVMFNSVSCDAGNLSYENKDTMYRFPSFNYSSSKNPTHTFDENWNLIPINQTSTSDTTLTTNNGSITSTGGSSAYYQLRITRKTDGVTFDCEAGDLIYSLFGNDFDFGNVQKALIRIYQATQGKGKAGTSIDYDIEKIKYFLEEVKKVNKNPQRVNTSE